MINGNEKNWLYSLMQTIRMLSSDIGMTFGIKKCAMIEMKHGRNHKITEINLLDSENIKSSNVE